PHGLIQSQLVATLVLGVVGLVPQRVPGGRHTLLVAFHPRARERRSAQIAPLMGDHTEQASRPPEVPRGGGGPGKELQRGPNAHRITQSAAPSETFPPVLGCLRRIAAGQGQRYRTTESMAEKPLVAVGPADRHTGSE